MQSAVRVLLILTPLVLVGCARAPDLELTQKFQAAELAFAKARSPDEFLRVAVLYQEILDAGLDSGAVLYNQGNAFMNAGQRGRAIACYRQAQRYRPRDPYLEHNLRLALGSEYVAPKPALIDYFLFWQDWISYRGKFEWLALGGVLAFGLGAAAVFYRRRALRTLAVAALALTVVAGVSAGYDWYRFQGRQNGTLTADGVIARKGNADSYEPAFTQPLPQGTEFQVLENRGDWLLIRVVGGKEGWVTKDSAVVY